MVTIGESLSRDFHVVRTGTDGSFETVALPTGLEGVVLLTVALVEDSSFPCDAPGGCESEAGRIAFGERVRALGELEMLLPVEDLGSDSVTISPFTHIAAERARLLAGSNEPGADAVRQAHEDVASILNEVLGVLGDEFLLDGRYYRLRLPDLTSSSTDDLGQASPTAVAVALLGAGLLELPRPPGAPEDAALAGIASFARAFAQDGVLPASDDAQLGRLTQDQLVDGLRSSLARLDNDAASGVSAAVRIAERLPPGALAALSGALPRLRDLPPRRPAGDLRVDATVPFSIELGESEPQTSGFTIQPIETPTFEGARFVVVSDTPWVSGTVAPSVPGSPPQEPSTAPFPEGVRRARVEVTIDVSQLQGLAGPFDVAATIRDDAGIFRDFSIRIQVRRTPLVRFSFARQTVRERNKLTLTLPQLPVEVSDIRWRQLSGPLGTFTNADRTEAVFTAPAVDQDEIVTLAVSFIDAFGATPSRAVVVDVRNNPSFAEVQRDFPPFEGCSIGDGDSEEDVGLVESLSCRDIDLGALAPLADFDRLHEVDLTDSSFSADFDVFAGLRALQRIDVGQAPRMRCAPLDELRATRPEFVIEGADACVHAVSVPVGGELIAYLPERDELFVARFGLRDVAVIDASAGNVKAFVPIPGKAIALHPAGDGRLLVRLELSDSPVFLDPETRTVAAEPLFQLPSDFRLQQLAPLRGGRLVMSGVDDDTSRLFVGGSVPLTELLPGAAPGVRSFSVAEDLSVLYGQGSFGGDVFAITPSDAGVNVTLGLNTPPDFVLEDSVLSRNGSRLATARPELYAMPDFELLESAALTLSNVLLSEDGRPFLFPRSSSTGVLRHTAHVFDATHPDGLRPIYDGPFCENGFASGYGLDERGTRFLWSNRTDTCVVGRRDRIGAAASPVAFPDAQLTACVVAAGGDPLTLTSLDCSAFPGIRRLDGLERMKALQRLRLRGSALVDARPASHVADIAIVDDPVFGSLDGLRFVEVLDLTGTPNVRCTEIDRRLRNSSVTAPDCSLERVVPIDASSVSILADPSGERVFLSRVPLEGAVVEVLSVPDLVPQMEFSFERTAFAAAYNSNRDVLVIRQERDLHFIDLSTGARSVVNPFDELGIAPYGSLAFLTPEVLLAYATDRTGAIGDAVRIDLGADLVATVSELSDFSALPVDELERLGSPSRIGRTPDGVVVELDTALGDFRLERFAGFDTLAVPRRSEPGTFDLLSSFLLREATDLRSIGTIDGSGALVAGPSRVVSVSQGVVTLVDTEFGQPLVRHTTDCAGFPTGVLIDEMLYLAERDRICVLPVPALD